MLTLSKTRIESWQSKASDKEGLWVELKVGAWVTPEETEAMGLGHVVVLAKDYETAKARVQGGRCSVALAPDDAKATLKVEASSIDGFRFKFIEDLVWCGFTITTVQPTEKIAQFWDLMGRATGVLTIEGYRTTNNDDVRQDALKLAENVETSKGIDSLTITAFPGTDEEESVTIDKDTAKQMRGEQ